MLVIELAKFDAFLVDLDGVITRTATVHAAAWKRLFDEDLAAQVGTAFVPFDADADYRRWMRDSTRLQRHVGSAIACNVWQYYQVSGDVTFLVE